MSNANNENNSFKMTGSSVRNYTNEETNIENIVKILKGKHKKLIEEKEENSMDMSIQISNKMKKQCKILKIFIKLKSFMFLFNSKVKSFDKLMITFFSI